MTSYRTTNDVIWLKLQWRTRIYPWGNVPCYSSSNNAKYLKIDGRKVECTRNSNFGDYPGDIRL